MDNTIHNWIVYVVRVFALWQDALFARDQFLGAAFNPTQAQIMERMARSSTVFTMLMFPLSLISRFHCCQTERRFCSEGQCRRQCCG